MKPSSGMRSPKRSLQPPSPHHQRTSAPRQHGLQLSGLPRFHPANYYSAHSVESSTGNTPSSGLNSPQAPSSPRAQNRQYSEAQRQLYLYQRELVNMNRGPPPSSNLAAGGQGQQAMRSSPLPSRPNLPPIGSPGPVTPLELDERDGYLVAGSQQHAGASQLNEAAKDEIVEAFIKNEKAANAKVSSEAHARNGQQRQ